MHQAAPLHVSHPRRSSLELHDNNTCTNPSTMYEIILVTHGHWFQKISANVRAFFVMARRAFRWVRRLASLGGSQVSSHGSSSMDVAKSISREEQLLSSTGQKRAIISALTEFLAPEQLSIF